MPLHDWDNRDGFSGLHMTWITELLRHIKPKLPTGYRAYVGQLPFLAVGIQDVHPDLGVLTANGKYTHVPEHQWMENRPLDEIAPDFSTRVAVLETPQDSVMVEFHGLIVAAIEIISPSNKDRKSEKGEIVTKCFTYLKKGIHLMIIDVHARPKDFSIAELIERELGIAAISIKPPFAVSYRVEPIDRVAGGHLDVWRRTFVVGHMLPQLPLTLGPGVSVMVDLEETYTQAADLNYVS